ncbi:hypothetical protein HBI13_175700 [Parastagonospora nodorum]|nr:hypothetical protein HBI10_183600 [Parastagonospora nodorum]KAH4014065.1 hypothetical protein HBI13_175700 [Parastagonospora nodorum]
MAPPGKDKDKDKDKEKEKEKERDDGDEYDSDEGDQPTTTSAEGILGPPGPPSPTDINSISKPYHPGPHLPGPPPPVGATGGGASPLPGIQPTSSPSWTTYPVTASPFPETISSSQPASLSSLSATYGATWPTGTQDPGNGGGNGGGTWSDPGNNGMAHPGMYAAAAVTPIVVLVIIAATVFLCMRKRKRRRQLHEPTVSEKEQESKMRSQTPPVVQAYMAPSLGASPQYAHSNHHLPPTNPATTQPIILGPIPSGSNGAYFTGIDTSDVVSMTSTNNFRPPPNPFSDNESLSEPPPPYRPRSIAPPSFSNSSRHSSFRAPNPPETSSQTHLIGRSPFDDPDDDAISELSGPTEGHGEAMSAVSDLSYQNEPVLNRPAL